MGSERMTNRLVPFVSRCDEDSKPGICRWYVQPCPSADQKDNIPARTLGCRLGVVSRGIQALGGSSPTVCATSCAPSASLGVGMPIADQHHPSRKQTMHYPRGARAGKARITQYDITCRPRHDHTGWLTAELLRHSSLSFLLSHHRLTHRDHDPLSPAARRNLQENCSVPCWRSRLTCPALPSSPPPDHPPRNDAWGGQPSLRRFRRASRPGDRSTG
ncbi:hypothetical protein EV126DRAFT_410534 [Verticillium dahliae]|nr:hypothetical protein EV126DRAFT_435550 [Verticillium dahliae]KAH6706978.1 hypothetical protein EV126DRAFT_410534 [Verticillium dahliae]